MTDEEGRAFARRPGALPELVRRMKDPDNEERAFMATLIGVAGGAEAVAPLLDALMDEDSLVAWRAVEALEAVKAHLWAPTLLKALDLQPDPAIRGALALLYGKLGASAKDLRARYNGEPEILAALARLGDEEARVEFGRRPSHKHLEYARGPWMLKYLLPLLDDETRVVQGAHVVTDNECREIGGKRMCDLAVEEAAHARKFTFEVPQLEHYTPAQIDEVRRFLRGC